jgi:hypothetical protein
MSELAVVTMFMDSSPNYEFTKSEREEHYHRFVKHMANSGATLYTVEIARDAESFKITSKDNKRHLQLITSTPQIWNKERAINLAIDRLVPLTVDYIAWLDCDIIFCNPDWVGKTIHLLRKWQVVHMFSHTLDLGPNWQPVGDVHEGYVYRYVNGRPIKRGQEISGLGWATRRSVLDELPLLDWNISSGADSLMAVAFFGNNKILLKHIPAYKDKAKLWINAASRIVNGQVGYVQGLVLHSWHGPRDGRGYGDVERIMIRDKFNPFEDITTQANGLYCFTGKNKKLEKDMNDWYISREGI